MIKLYSHENRMILFNIRNLLENEGIETLVVNEFAAGGVGDLPAFDTWPELWLTDESRLTEAQQLLQFATRDGDDDDWQCPACHESNPEAFQTCWNCGSNDEA